MTPFKNWYQTPQVTEDWKFGNGQGYRPGRDPMMDRRMWQPRPSSFQQMMRGRVPGARSFMPQKTTMPYGDDFSSFIHQNRQMPRTPGWGMY